MIRSPLHRFFTSTVFRSWSSFHDLIMYRSNLSCNSDNDLNCRQLWPVFGTLSEYQTHLNYELDPLILLYLGWSAIRWEWCLSLFLIGGSSFMRRFVVSILSPNVVVFVRCMVSVVSVNRILAPKQVNAVLEGKEVHGAPGQNVWFIFCVNWIAGVLKCD